MLLPCPPGLVSEAVSDAVQQCLEGLPAGSDDTRSGIASHSLEAGLTGLFAVSPYLQSVCRRQPESLAHWLAEGALSNEQSQASVKSWLQVDTVENQLSAALEQAEEQVSSNSAEALLKQQQRVLRRYRHHRMLRILARDLLELACLDETLHELSVLAEGCVRTACDWADAAMALRFGEPRDAKGARQHLIIIGMGKLGGGELNVSSDIDLVHVYPGNGHTDGRKSIDNAEFFRRVTQRFAQLLGSVTDDGFVYRVDTRLRPFGESGPPVITLDGLENYYLTQGRDWERYAMIKARALTGKGVALVELDALLTPFVYRRYLDYHAIESLRILKQKISQSVQTRGLVDNIKLGAGGIREIEFLGQAIQLVRGGREPTLQQRPIRQVLRAAGQLGLMPDSDVQGLVQAYEYLRRVENALQSMRDQQVHSLPTDGEDQLRLCTMLSQPDWSTFRRELADHQSMVERCFARLFAEPDPEGDETEADAPAPTVEQAGTTQRNSGKGENAWHSAALAIADLDDVEDRLTALTAAGFESSDELLAQFDAVTRGLHYQRLTARAQECLDAIVPMVLDTVIDMSDDSVERSLALTRSLSFLRTVSGRSGYVQALIERPRALQRLVRLFQRSAWLAGFVERHPSVIDELLTPTLSAEEDAAQVLQAARDEATSLCDAPLDEQMDALRRFQQVREFRITVAELDGELSLMQVSDQLSWLAEAVLDAVLFLVRLELVTRHGEPICQTASGPVVPEAGVVAYGKLGGLELGHGSDLDLVFLHDSPGKAGSTNGPKPIENAVFHARLAQKVVSFMSTLMPTGILYEVDLRLRPNGQSGVLVTGLDAFGAYQRDDAWTWEHQALVRARLVVGSDRLRRRFDEVRASVLSEARDSGQLRTQVGDMRARMRTHLGSSTPGHMHLKQDAGGVADIEFMVQYLVLAHASEHPRLLEFTDNIRQLDVIAELVLLCNEDVQNLKGCYLDLRQRLHHQALQLADASVPDSADLEAVRQRVTELWQKIL